MSSLVTVLKLALK